MNTRRLDHLPEYLRPWKLATLAIGIALLILGSFYYRAPDWNISISFIMAIQTIRTRKDPASVPRSLHSRSDFC